MSTTGTAAIDQEIAQEKAEALGLAGRLLVAALGELRDYDASGRAQYDPSGAIREGLVARAAYRAQNVIIQRESHGLRDAHYVLGFYSVPREIVMRIGVSRR
jgi:hypothetical protein